MKYVSVRRDVRECEPWTEEMNMGRGVREEYETVRQ